LAGLDAFGSGFLASEGAGRLDEVAVQAGLASLLAALLAALLATLLTLSLTTLLAALLATSLPGLKSVHLGHIQGGSLDETCWSEGRDEDSEWNHVVENTSIKNKYERM
jgi:hypothetical protein